MEQRNLIVIPQWLDKFLFQDLSATYNKKHKDLVVLEWNDEDILGYLGTYFPRSYAESYRIFSFYFSKYKQRYEFKTSISLFDFGCGTGGELIGFIIALSETLPNIKEICIRALDGNMCSLRHLEAILDRVAAITNIEIESRLMPVIIDDFYDMKVVIDVITEKYDFIISFKAICEFVTKKEFEEKNPYEHIINAFLSKLASGGIFCIADITSFNKITNEWLTVLLDKASDTCDVDILERNEGYNEEVLVTHSSKKCDRSKIAWRIYKPNKFKL